MTIETVTEIGRQAMKPPCCRHGFRPEPRCRLDGRYCFQAVMTQINGRPRSSRRVLAVFAATLLFLPWMMGVLIAFMTHIITSIPTLIH